MKAFTTFFLLFPPQTHQAPSDLIYQHVKRNRLISRSFAPLSKANYTDIGAYTSCHAGLTEPLSPCPTSEDTTLFVIQFI